VATDMLPRLEERVERYVAERRSEIASLEPERIDTESSLAEIDARLYAELTSLAPFGPGNPRPVFLLRDCSFERLTLVGNRKQHLKGQVAQGGATLPFIAFRMGRHLETFEGANGVALVCQVGFDDWQGKVQAQGIDLVAEGSSV
jgi:single-stranded-DNA-specific exonuclease